MYAKNGTRPQMKNFDSIVILGPTASGKTKLAVEIAYLISSEIISIDSRMVYKKLNIGTGKDLGEYCFENKSIPYHLIDVCEPNESYHIYQFQQDFKMAFNQILEAKKTPILCGGSGLYLEAVIKDFIYTGIPVNPLLRAQLEMFSLTQLQEQFLLLPENSFKKKADLESKKRTIRAHEIAHFLLNNSDFLLPEPKPLEPFIIGLNPTVDLRRENIIKRLHARMDEGLIEEVSCLLKSGVSFEKLLSLGLEYKFVCEFLMGKYNKQKMIELLGIAIQQFAKRQMTYFRKMEKSGLKINWVCNHDEALILLKNKKFIV